MRVLAICIGSAGDVIPFIRIGTELSKRGHEVTVLANGYFSERIRKANLPFIELGTPTLQRLTMKHIDLANLQKFPEFFVQNQIRPIIQPTHQKIVELYRPGKTIVLASRFAFGAQEAREKIGVPVVTVALTPHALNKGQAVSFFSPDGVIGLFPKWYAAPQRGWPARTKLVGFATDGSLDYKPEPRVMQFLDGEKPIIFTPGTSIQNADLFFRRSLQICQALKCRGLFVTPFRRQIPNAWSKLVTHAADVPFNWLFHRARAVIHSGGIGTMAQAMAAGIPQVIVPLAFDQFDNAERVKKLGVGESILQKNYDAATASKRLSKLIQSQAVQRRCKELSRRLDGKKAITDASDLLESISHHPMRHGR